MNIDKNLKLFTLSLMLLIGISGVYAARGLYADGSFWLFEILSRDGFYIFDPHRAHAQILVQLPVVVLLELGVQDLNLLIRAHSFGFVFVPLIFWIVALSIQIHTRLFWFFLIAYSATYLRSNFFAAGEFNITYAMTAFCASILLRHEINRTLAVFLILTSVALTHSYEMTLFLGILLISLSGWRLWHEKQDGRVVRYCIMTAAIFFLLSIYIGFESAFFQRTYDGRSTANLSALQEIHFLYLLVAPMLVAALCLTKDSVLKNALAGATVLLIVVYSIYASRWDNTNISFGYLSYAYRALVGVLLIEIVLLTFITHKKDVKDSRLGLVVTFFFLSLAFLMLQHTYGFYNWLKRFEEEAISIERHTPIDNTTINTNHGLTTGYNWPWGNSYTSILLRGDTEAVILNNSSHHSNEGGCYERLHLSLHPEADVYQKCMTAPFARLKKDGRLFR
jgi:hypothetical protein